MKNLKTSIKEIRTAIDNLETMLCFLEEGVFVIKEDAAANESVSEHLLEYSYDVESISDAISSIDTMYGKTLLSEVSKYLTESEIKK